MGKLFLNIEGIVEIQTSFIDKDCRQEIQDAFSLDLCSLVEKYNGVFGGGIKEVDENGDDLK